MIDDEDYAYEMLRQKEIDEMSPEEFFRVFTTVTASPSVSTYQSRHAPTPCNTATYADPMDNDLRRLEQNHD